MLKLKSLYPAGCAPATPKYAEGSKLEHVIADLVDGGVSPAAIDAAIALMRTGRADLISRVIDGHLDVEAAARIARQP